MEKVILKNYVKIKTGKLDANASEVDGIYPFFTCAREISRINVFAFDCECVLVAGNGELNVKYYEGKFNAYQRTYVIESIDKNVLSVKYLYYFIDSYIEKLRNGAIGGVIKYIKLNHLTDIELPLPDIERQNKIVAILDKAKAILDKRAKTISKYDELLKATFWEMFGDPVTNPKGWKLVELNEICTKITDGTHKTPKYLSEGIKFISAKNIVNNSISWLDIKYISETESNSINSRCNPEFEDILLTKSGSLGQPALIDVDFKFTLFESLALIKYRRDKVTPSFLITYLMSDGVAYFYKQRHKGVAVKHIHLVDIKSIPVYLPPIELQKKFEEKYKQFHKLISVVRSSNFKSEELLKSLTQQVFNERIIIDVDAELEALINAIDLDKMEEDNKIDTIINDITFIQRLIDRLNEQEFDSKNQYDKAKYILFRIMKKEEDLIKQILKDKRVQLTLQNETA